jgi:DNA polymerase-3 subunit delta'
MISLYPWQRRQWLRVLSQFQQNRLPHALLLSGPSGLGKSQFAEQLAHLLLCKTPHETACGSCSGCRLISANNHPDLFKLSPEEAGKNIKIDQIRELTTALHQTGQRAGFQVAIINPAEALNKAAANALLKTLEEPEGQVMLLLVSSQPGKLPPTITSRCQGISFSATADVRLWLKEQLEQIQSTTNVDLLLKMAENAPLRAFDLAQNNYLKIRDHLVMRLYEAGQHNISMLSVVGEFLKENLELWIHAFISLINDVIRLHLNVAPEYLINHDILPQLKFLQKTHSPASAWRLFEKLIEVRQFLQSTSIHLNEQLLIESVLIDLGN